jgi:hypothetical protein
MKQYKALSESEIDFYQKQLILPKIDYPHYPSLIIDGVNIQEHTDITPLTGEVFCKHGTFDKLHVSNYGRILYDNEIVKLHICGTFLHCTFFFIEDIGEHRVYRFIKETFDPIENMDKLQVHHINNNALDNRPQNLLWVTPEDHSKIDSEFNVKLRECSTIIRKNVKNKLVDFFKNNSDKTFTGFEICLLNQNVFAYVIRDVLDGMEKTNIIENILGDKKFFYDKKYILIKPNCT